MNEHEEFYRLDPAQEEPAFHREAIPEPQPPYTPNYLNQSSPKKSPKKEKPESVSLRQPCASP